jgi:ubiquinone/menaquinone biosynthesis C-methylase UbiE
MATIEDNVSSWDGGYNWKNRGDEWSSPWGGPFMQWYGSIYPRIKRHLPADSILEIACGYGRWTQYLKDMCEHLTAIDLSEECIRSCKLRFAKDSQIEYHVNDGKSLGMIPDDSINFVFSFDSLVHANETVIDAYLSQFARILKKDGVCFIHHSNLGEYHTLLSRFRRVPKLEGILARAGVLEKSLGWRDPKVDAKKVASFAERHGLRCVSQELVPWNTKRLYIDCMSTIVRKDSPIAWKNRVLRNATFMQEANNLLRLSSLYSPRE